jgi:hypothetical protein
MSPRRGDLVESAVAALFAGMVGLVVGAYEPIEQARSVALGKVGAFELQPLAERFGRRNSLNAEEWIIRDFFDDRRGGVFLDVGAGHYSDGSNTYFLETQLEWTGLAVDALTRYAEGYRDHRPATRFVAAFVSDVSDGSVDLHVPAAFPYAASDAREHARAHDRGGAIDSQVVATITLNDLLAGAEMERIDFMSMDIELAEPRALAGFAGSSGHTGLLRRPRLRARWEVPPDGRAEHVLRPRGTRVTDSSR